MIALTRAISASIDATRTPHGDDNDNWGKCKKFFYRTQPAPLTGTITDFRLESLRVLC